MSEESSIHEVISTKISDNDLMFFANLANKFGAELGVTFLIKGAWLTGTVISGKSYYHQLAASLGVFQEGSLNEVLADYFKDVETTHYTLNDGEERELPLNFIHLKNVWQQNGTGSFKPINNAYLRVKIEEVDGYILGVATTE